ncbi:MAG TPA: helix-turn-helix domain-containing protein [Candidatus Dormibacteraeota bacterium]|jgi:AcrR family transcriptional regulator|nr:helix-turn-helix domain-containing protein [Candidatus Dormibacteraeota bacterium]
MAEEPMTEGERPLRADARRNRERVLEVAFAAFAEDGLSVPVQEIARRAGVGTGTVSRHFPTKEALFQAILLRRADGLMERAEVLAQSGEPGEAFFRFFSLVVAEGAMNRGMAEALAGAGFDLEAAVAGTGHDIMGTLRGLLERAQRAGDVRSDIDAADVKALLTGCLARERATVDAGARERMIAIVYDGLRPQR